MSASSGARGAARIASRARLMPPLMSDPHASAPARQPVPAPVVHALALLRTGRPIGGPLGEGVREAVAAVYRCYGAEVRGLVEPIVGAAGTDEVVHDLFCRLPALAADYREGGFEEWLLMTAARVARSAARGRGDVTWGTAPPPDALLARILGTLAERATGPPEDRSR